jgi:hypothetical protein
VVDVFEEVDEQLRSQRFETLISRGWPFVAAAAAAALLGALGLWGWNAHEADAEAKASASYQKALDAAARGDADAAGRGFQALAAGAPPAYRSLSLMQEAQLALQKNRTAEAVADLDQAAKVAPILVMADGARLRAAMLVMDKAPLAEVEGRLAPLLGPNAPYRALALEARAMARLQAGRFAEAKTDFEVLGLSQDVSQAAQTRAHAALDLIRSGAASAVGAAARAALALPQDQIPTLPPGPSVGAPGGAGDAQ